MTLEMHYKFDARMESRIEIYREGCQLALSFQKTVLAGKWQFGNVKNSVGYFCLLPKLDTLSHIKPKMEILHIPSRSGNAVHCGCLARYTHIIYRLEV